MIDTMNIPEKKSAHEASNTTSNRLKRLIPEIMNLWEQRALEEIQAANLQETLALRNSLPIYLTQLVDALSNTINRSDARARSDKNDSTRIGKKHGRERAECLDYTMDQMIVEYHILRQVICDVMEQEAELSAVEREVIVCSIEQAVNDAATQFSDSLRDFQDQLTHTLAHDLRNPLTTVKANAQLIAGRPTDEKGSADRAYRIIKGIDRIDKMIQELLDASRIKAVEKLSLKFNECDLDWLAKDVAADFNLTYHDKVIVHSNLSCVGCWDENGIRRLIENLVSNALKYGEANSLVTLSIEQSDDDATLSIHNEGNPIPKSEIPGMFEHFARSKSVQNKIGWGLGLSIVKVITESHRGTIRVESDAEKGTSFIIHLPKRQES